MTPRRRPRVPVHPGRATSNRQRNRTAARLTIACSATSLDPIRAPQGRQLTALAEGHVALVARGDGGIDRDGFVPEHTKHLHAVAIVPDRGRHDTARPRHSNHLPQGFRRIGDEVHHEQRKGLVEARVGPLERLRVAHDEGDQPDVVVRRSRLCVTDVRGRWIHAGYAYQRARFRDRERECASARANVQHGVPSANGHELSRGGREAAAPSAHEPLIGVTPGEDLSLLWHGTPHESSGP